MDVFCNMNIIINIYLLNMFSNMRHSAKVGAPPIRAVA